MEVATSTTTTLVEDGVEKITDDAKKMEKEVEDNKEGEDEVVAKAKEEDEISGEKEISSSENHQNEEEEEPDVKKKSETPDVLCLQLDEGDNLDGYLEKEKARKKELEMSKLKEEEKINHQELNEKSKSFEKKKKSGKITPKKVKSKIESVNKDQEENSIGDKVINEGDVKENVEDDDDDNDNDEDKKELNQPEVSVKSTVVKCDKNNKGDDKENKDGKENRFLWVSNINRYTKANDLKVHFTPHGKVQTARIVTDGKNYYGYLLMERREDVENCIEKLEGTMFDGITIHLSEKKPEQKSKSTERKIDSRRKSSQNSSVKNDPLTLKVKDYKNEKDYKNDKDYKNEKDSKNEKDYKSEKDFKNEKDYKNDKESLLKKRSEEEQRRKNREAERIREERRKERIKFEQRKAQEMKIEREKRKLEHERRLIEEEKINLLRLQKRLAVTERSIIQRQKQDLERDIKNLEYKKRKSETTPYERKPKLSKITENEKYWKKDSSSKTYDDNYKKVDSILVPPPPVLSETYHQKASSGDKERNWKEISKESALESRFSYDYERYQKDHRYKEKEKNYHWESGYNCGNNTSNNNAWRGQDQRNVNRHSVSAFPVAPGNVYQVQSSTQSYYQGNRKSSDYYYRGSDRKY